MITDAIERWSRAATCRARRPTSAMMQVMGGEATPAADRRVPGRAADEGRDAGRDRRLRARDARARRRRRGPRAPTWSTRPAPAATAPTRSTSRRRRRSSRPRAARRSPSTATGRCRRAAGRPTCSRRSACASTSRPSDVAECIDEVGFGFLFAQAHHPAMRHAGPVRRELGVRTVFNLLGPLTNPAGARRQVVGVYAPRAGRADRAGAGRSSGAEHAMVVHGAGGLDELTPTGENLVAEVRDGAGAHVHARSTRASSGPGRAAPDDLRGGGDPAQNAAIILHRVRRRARAPPRRRDPERRRRPRRRRAAPRPRSRASTLRRRRDRRRRARLATLERAGRVHPRRGPERRHERLPGTARRRHPPRRAGADARLRRRAARPGPPVAVIAEVKRASPSQGAIAPDADVGDDRAAYAAGGAAAISVLCAERDFGGIARPTCRRPAAAVRLPALAKDFTVVPRAGGRPAAARAPTRSS